MSDERRQPDDHASGDPLDRLLAEARWPEPSPEAITRLEAEWDRLNPAPLRGPKLWRPAAAAAVLLLAIAAASLLLRKSPQPITKAPTPPETRVTTSSQPAPIIASRAPSLWEQAAMLHGSTITTTAASIDRVQPAIDQAIVSLTTTPRADLQTVATRLLQTGPRSAIEQHLLDDLPRRSGVEAVAAIRLLGTVGSRSAVPALLDLYAVADNRPAVAASIAELLSPAELAALIKDEPLADRQRHLLGLLAIHPHPQALSSYLAFVASPATSETALAALDDLPHAPVDALFAHLDAPRMDRRLAAARALGRINGPAVSERLATMVERGLHRREALAALLSSNGPEAARALSSFQRMPSLVSVIRSIELQLRNPF